MAYYFQGRIIRSAPGNLIIIREIFNKVCGSGHHGREISNNCTAIEAFPAAYSTAGESVSNSSPNQISK